MKNLYGPLKLFNYPDKIAAIGLAKITAPIQVRIKPINACNHRCWFCAYRAESLDLGSEMSLKDRIPREKMLEIVKDLIEMKVEAVTFSGGGEPLIYPHIVETVRALGEGGIRVATLTNGAFLKDDVAEAFACYGTWIRISLDSWDEKSCTENRKVKHGEFKKILENIANFKKLGKTCRVGVSFIVMPGNATHLYEAAKRLKDAGVEHVKFSPCIIGNSAEENNNYHAPIESVVMSEIERSMNLNDSSFQIVNHYHLMEGKFKKEYCSCPFMQMLTVIGADCMVHTCQDKAYTPSGCLGSIKERSFKDLWFSEEVKERLLTFNPAKECSHHCVANEKNMLLHSFLSLDREHLAFV